jgi:hypothetical protein
MLSALHVQSTFLDMSHSITAGHLPHSALEPRFAETTTSASHLEAHLQVAPVEQLPENHDIVEQSACQQIGAHDRVSDDSTDAEADLIPTFADSMRIIPCPEMTFVDVEHTITRKTRFVCPQNVV